MTFDSRVEPLRTGVHESLITRELRARLLQLGEGLTREELVDLAESPVVLSQYVGALVRRRLEALPLSQRTTGGVRVVNQVLDSLADAAAPVPDGDGHRLAEGPSQLLEVFERPADLGEVRATSRPVISLGASDVLLGDRGERSAGAVIESEFPSADRVDLICSFLKWSGYRLLRDAIRDHVRGHGRCLRVLTTTYVGVTERRVLDDLRNLGAEVRVSYEHQRTRLHAKAWLFHRRDGLTTAIVGSSNVSHSALVDGLEWNVRLSGRVTPDAVRKLAATFDALWRGDEFESYEPARDAAAFDRAIEAGRGDRASVLRVLVDLRPHSFQQEMLDRLATEREIHGRHRNLLVAATGTGKTVVAAIDFARLRRDHPDWRLLFVAHRREILEQARDTYRHALRDARFGHMLAGGETPRAGASVFATIQSLHENRVQHIDPCAYDVVVVDEFHHASAASYRALLEHVRPTELLGLTATPERADDLRVQDEFFGGRIAAELRLWDALDRGLLVPFHYFGVADGTDLRNLRWCGGYDASQLQSVFTGNEVRLRVVLRAVTEYVSDCGSMRALGFCSGVEHARWMAEMFTEHGIPSVALSGDSGRMEREGAVADLRARVGGIRAIFTADLFNEGVDIPEVDVLLLLRPTDSHVLFQQQLGRGLRRAEAAGKSCLTVLDFVGLNHRRFRMHRRLAALCGGATRRDVELAVQAAFPVLPAGCAVRLEPQARAAILDNLRQAAGNDVRSQVRELQALGPHTTLAEYVERTGSDLEDIYRRSRCWSELRRRAGFGSRPPADDAAALRRGIGRLLHVDDAPRLRWLAAALARGPAIADGHPNDIRRWQMLEVLLTGRASGGPAGVQAVRATIARDTAARDELQQLSALLLQRVERPSYAAEELTDLPLRVHGSYSTREALSAFGRGELQRIDSGVFHLRELGADAFFVTLAKSARDYSPSTLYRDYAITQDLFHWESQSTTSRTSETGVRYVTHRARGHRILLFVREKRQRAGRASPYVFLGLADHVSNEGSQPIAIVWRLRRPMPPALFRQAALVRATG